MILLHMQSHYQQIVDGGIPHTCIAHGKILNFSINGLATCGMDQQTLTYLLNPTTFT